MHRYTGVAPRVSLHIPWDLVDDFGKLAAHAARPRRLDRRDQLQRLPGRRLQARLAHPRRPGGPPQGDRPPRRSASTSCARPARTDLKLWLPDGTNYPGQDDIRARQDRLAESLQQIYALLEPDQRMLLEYKFFEPSFYAMDIPDWGTSLRALPGAGRAGARRPRHRPPRARHQHRVHRRAAAARRPARRVRLQLALLRRRRPDGRLGRPVPAVPDHARDRRQRRAAARVRGQLHARPVPQHRAEDPRPDPVGDERPGGDGEGAARRPGGAGRGAAGR